MALEVAGTETVPKLEIVPQPVTQSPSIIPFPINVAPVEMPTVENLVTPETQPSDLKTLIEEQVKFLRQKNTAGLQELEESKINALHNLFRVFQQEAGNPTEIENLNRMRLVFGNLFLSLKFDDPDIYRQGSFKNEVFNYIFKVRRIFEDENLANALGLPENSWGLVEQHLMGLLNQFSAEPKVRAAEELMRAVVKKPETYLNSWSHDFKRQLIQRLFLNINSEASLENIKILLESSEKDVVEVMKVLYANPDITAVENELKSNIYGTILLWLAARDNKSLEDIAFKLHSSDDVHLKTLGYAVYFLKPEIETTVENKFMLEEISNSRKVKKDIELIKDGLAKTENLKALEQDPKRPVEVGRFTPIAALQKYFKNLRAKDKTDEPNVENSITLLESYLVDGSQQSREDFLKYMLVPTNLENLTYAFNQLYQICLHNNLEGLRERIYRIFRKALFNPQIFVILPPSVKNFAFEIWNKNLDKTFTEYRFGMEDVVTTTSGKSIFNTPRNLIEKYKKQNQISQIYEKVSAERHQTIVAMKKIFDNPNLVRLYFDTPGFSDVVLNLFTNIMAHDPLTSEDSSMLLDLFESSTSNSSLWELMPTAIKRRICETVIRNFVAGKKDYVNLVNLVLVKTGSPTGAYILREPADYLTAVYRDLVENDAQFKSTADQLKQKKSWTESKILGLKRVKETPDAEFVTLFKEFVSYADMNYGTIDSGVEAAENDISVKMAKLLTLLSKAETQKEMLSILRDLYVFIINADQVALKSFFELFPKNKMDMVSKIFTHLIMYIYINKHSLPEISLSKSVFENLVDLMPKDVIRSTESPFIVVSRAVEMNPKISGVISYQTQEQLTEMQKIYNQKVAA